MQFREVAWWLPKIEIFFSNGVALKGLRACGIGLSEENFFQKTLIVEFSIFSPLCMVSLSV